MASRRPVSPGLRAWLAAPGSLTARLRSHGEVRVEVLDQGRRRLWPQERRALGCGVGHVREVILHVGDRPAVWARSSVSARAVKGPWRAIKGLGTRPLAELLFSHHAVSRGPLHACRIGPHGLEGGHLGRQWPGQAAGATPVRGPAPAWVRHSVFRHRGHPLQVMEAFAPWVLHLDCRRR